MTCCNQRGVVLVAVLLIVLLLAVILLEFNYEATLALDVSANCYRSQQSLYCAEAGAAVAMAALRQCANPLADEKLRPLVTGGMRVPVGDGFSQVSLTPESGKLCINNLRPAGGGPNRRRVEQLLRLIDLLNAQPGMKSPISYDIVPAIIDWVDEDDVVTVLPYVQKENAGAEDAYYMALTPPHYCKNALFDSLEELLMVRGVTQLMLDGRPGDAAAKVPPLEGMRQFLTLYGDGKVNVNHAPAFVLQSLSEGIDASTAQEIIAQRTERPFELIEELRLVPGMTAKVFALIRPNVTVSSESRYYRIIATGAVYDITRQVQMVVKRRGTARTPAVLFRQEL